MAKIPKLTSQTETYPGRQPDILQHRASVVSNSIQRILEVVPAVSLPAAKEETQVIDSTMTDDQKRERILNMKPFVAEVDPMPQDVYIEALAAETASGIETSASSNTTNSDLLGTALAALDDIFGPRSEE